MWLNFERDADDLSDNSDMINTTGSPAAAVATPKEYFREFSDNNVSEHIEIHLENSYALRYCG